MPAVNKRILQPGERIRVLVVDDSVVIRRLVTNALEQDPDLEVVGVAANGAIALQRIPQYNPDVLTLDIEMPEMDGLETLRRLRHEYPQLRVIMFSTLTERGAAVTLEALTLGASDYVTKASNEGSLDRSMARLREELIPKIKQFFLLPGRKPRCGEAGTGAGSRVAAAWRSKPVHAEYEGAAQGRCDRSFYGGADRSGRDPAATTGRVSLADFDCATHAAAVHAVSCRTSLHLLPAVRQRGEPGRSGGCRQDIDCAGRLSSQGGR